MYTVNPPWIDSPQTLRQQVEGRRHGSHLLDRLKREPCELSSTPYSSSSPWCYEVCLVDLQTSGLEFLKYLIGFWCFRYIFFSSAFSYQSYSIWFLSLKEFPKFQKYEWHSFVFPCDVTGTFILILKRFSVGEDTDICAHFSPQTIKIPRQQNCMLNKVFQPQLRICSQYNHGQFLS